MLCQITRLLGGSGDGGGRAQCLKLELEMALGAFESSAVALEEGRAVASRQEATVRDRKRDQATRRRERRRQLEQLQRQFDDERSAICCHGSLAGDGECGAG